MMSLRGQGAELYITDSQNTKYSMVIPPSDTRTIQFATPLTIQSATLSADNVDEEHPYLIQRTQTTNLDIGMRLGYIPISSCTDCSPKYELVNSSSVLIPSHTGTQPVTSTLNIPEHGEISSLSIDVDVSHSNIGDLYVELISPSNTVTVLHGKTGDSQENLVKTYTSTTNLSNLTGSQMHGDWTLAIHDTVHENEGTLNKWAIHANYTASSTPATPVPLPNLSSPIIFSDDFESKPKLSKWTESSGTNWRVRSTSDTTDISGAIPPVPNHPLSNQVLTAEKCITTCIVTVKEPIDLSEYSSATLTLWRYVESVLDEGEYLKVELYDGTRWTSVSEWSHNTGDNDDTWHFESIDLSSYLVDDFEMRFVSYQNKGPEDVLVDNVFIRGTPITQSSTTIDEDFGSGLSNWTLSGNKNWTTKTASPQIPSSPSSNRVAYASNCEIPCVMTLGPVDLSGRESGYLTLDRYVHTDLGGGEYLKVDLYDGSRWTTVFNWKDGIGDDSIWHTEYYDLSNHLVDDMQIRITAKNDDLRISVMVDNISISDTPPPPPPILTTISEDFEFGSSNWTLSGKRNWTTGNNQTPIVPSSLFGNKVAYVKNCHVPCILTLNPVDLSARSSGYLVFDRFVSTNLAQNDYFKIELYDGVDWTTAFNWTDGNGDNGTWRQESYNLSDHLVDNMQLRMVAQNPGGKKIIMIDNISISDTQPPPQPPIPTTISENFESGLSNWSSGERGHWTINTALPSSLSTNKVAHASDCSYYCTITLDPVDLSGRTSGYLVFDRLVRNLSDDRDHLGVYLYDGSTWTTAFNWIDGRGDDNTWHTESYDLSDHLVNNMQIRFSARGLGTTDVAMIDNISISDTQPPPQPPIPTTISENFESGLSNWTLSGYNNWITSTASPVISSSSSSNKVAFASDCDNTCIMTLGPIDLSGRTSGYLVFDRFADADFDRNIGERLEIELYDGSRWITAFNWNEYTGADNTWHKESYNLSNYLVDNMQIRITAQSSHISEVAMIDNISISNTPPHTTTISEDFHAGFPNWVLSGDSDWTINRASPRVPSISHFNNVAYASDCDALCIITLDPVDLSGSTFDSLTFYRFVHSEFDAGEYLKVELYDGSSWTTAFNWTDGSGDDSTWHKESYSLSNHLVDGMQIRITAKSSDATEIAMIDGISVT